MTDFIHEQPKPASQQSAPEQDKPPISERERQKKVYTYIGILFSVAFILILWTFLMSHRSNQELLSELRGNNSALESTASSLQAALDENLELNNRISQLEKQAAELASSVDALTSERDAALTARDEALQRLDAVNLLAQLEYQFAQEDYEACRGLIRQLDPLKMKLPEGGSPTAAERYAALVEAVSAQPESPVEDAASTQQP